MTQALVIDDNRNTADALVAMLMMLGVDGRAAYGPSQAMSVLNTLVPDIVLLDVNMPGVDGLEMLGYIRREPSVMAVPVIFITSDDQPETKQRALEGGALDLIVKPASIEQLEKGLKKAGVL